MSALQPDQLRARVRALEVLAQELVLEIQRAHEDLTLAPRAGAGEAVLGFLRAAEVLHEAVLAGSHPCALADAAPPTAAGFVQLARHLEQAHEVVPCGTRNDLERIHELARARGTQAARKIG